MSDSVIQVENVSKLYRLGEVGTGTLSHDFNRWWHKVRGKEDPYRKIGQVNDRTKKAAADGPSPASDYVWALQGVNFQVSKGEVLGIIGGNGAGKSTLLKVLSRVTSPTDGQIKVKGRIASLLEVGTGFNPEMTGRENIYLNGAIMGMRKKEIDRKFDEIVNFAEVDRYVDTPVKRYSSGMYVRLAFAVAAHLEPEILIVDEVLAVGDAQFQKKCLGKMHDVADKEKRTVLFVSHNMGAIAQLCSRCIILVKGQVAFNGSPEAAIEKYSRLGQSDQATFFDVEFQPRKYPGNQKARILSARFDRGAAQFASDEDFSFIVKIRANDELARLRISFTIFSVDGTPIGGVFSSDARQMPAGETSEFRATLACPNLAPGRYYCDMGIGRGDPQGGHVDYDVVQDVLHFEVYPLPGEDGTVSYWMHGWGRIMFPALSVESLAQPVVTL
jgi:lipopolysaccharide transport system ATP-binding protein